MAKSTERSKSERKGIIGRIAETMSGDKREDGTPSATKLLKKQHDDVRALFAQYDKTGENAHASRKRLIDEASRQLEIHAELEEKIFYPACRELEDEDARKMVGESLEEHLIVKRLIKELRGLDGSDETFEAKASVLKENVEHHADEEEQDLFPAAERELEDAQLEDLGARMEALKGRLTKRPSARPASAARRTART